MTFESVGINFGINKLPRFAPLAKPEEDAYWYEVSVKETIGMMHFHNRHNTAVVSHVDVLEGEVRPRYRPWRWLYRY